MPSIRNIIIFLSIAAVVIGGYMFFVKGKQEPTANLITSPNAGAVPVVPGGAQAAADAPPIAQDFLNSLLGVKNIKLDDSIFSQSAWNNLKDSSIELIPSGDEGRPNPFAPLGSDASVNVSAETGVPPENTNGFPNPASQTPANSPSPSIPAGGGTAPLNPAASTPNPPINPPAVTR